MSYPPPNSFDNIPIIHKTYKFYCKIYLSNKQLDKKDKFTIGQKSENIIFEILELLFMANAKRTEKSRLLILNKVDVKVKILKMIIRLSYEIKVISQGQYVVLITDLQELGKMLGGWIKSLQKKT